MRGRVLAALFGLAAVLHAAPAFAQTAAERAELDRVERIGRDLYEHDRAAWLATDEARLEIPQEDVANLRGWVTLREGDAVVVDFIAQRGDELWSVHRSTFRGGALTDHATISAPLDEMRRRLFEARNVALAAPAAICEQPYNVAVLPHDGAGEADADVYLMPATTVLGNVRVGGFVKHAVDIDAQRVVESQTFSRSCLALQQEQGVAMLFFTHITSPLPTETHVFLNLSHGVPLAVGAETGVWEVRNGHVTLLERRGP